MLNKRLILLSLLLPLSLLSQIYSVGNGSGFTGTCIGSPNLEIPLPIELIDWYAHCDNNVVSINWSTATESNCEKYILYKSHDSNLWEAIYEVHGCGSCSFINDYSYKYKASISDSISYLKLVQYDFDGTQTTFKYIYVSCTYPEFPIIIYPNPNNGLFTIQGLNSSGLLTVYNPVSNEFCSFTLNGISEACDFSILPSGFYFLVINNEGKTFTKKLVINK